MIEKWISRKEEHELPEFKNHDEARGYFKEKYGMEVSFDHLLHDECENICRENIDISKKLGLSDAPIKNLTEIRCPFTGSKDKILII
jgi:hypothetical protein